MILCHSKTNLRKFVLAIILFTLFLSFSNVLVSNSSLNDEIDDAIANADIVAFFDNSSIVIMDGVISVGEYQTVFNDSGSGIDLFLEHNKSHLFYGVIVPSTGWVAVGFNVIDVSSGMADADFKLASVVNGVPYANDSYSCNPGCGGPGFGQPLNDTINNITAFNGTESTKTSFEFILPFNSLDVQDFNMGVNDSLTTFVAYGPNDLFSSQHLDRTNKLTLFIAPELSQEIKNVNVVIELSLVNSEEINGSENFEIMAIVTNNETELPIEGLLITFYRKSSFGNLELGNNVTDSLGEAKIISNLTSYISEEIVLLARSKTILEGFDNYLSAESSIEIMYSFTDFEKSPDFGDIYNPYQISYLMPGLTLAGVFLSLTIIWTSFLYVLKTIFSFIFDKK